MAISAGDLTTLRAGGAHVVKPHLNVVPRVTIGTMRVNQSAFTYPRNAITVDGISLNGGLANIDAIPLNSQVWIGTASGGHDVMMSALANRSASASNIFVHGFGLGDPGVAVLQPVALADNQYITILAAKPLWGYLSRISAGLFYKKYNQAYTDEGSAPAPVCNIGPWQRVALTGASVDVTFTNAATTDVKPASFAWGSATITGYQWAFRNESYATTGAAFSGASTNAAATITFSTAGFYIVSCTITDSGGKTHTADTYVWIVDGSTEADIAGWRVENDVQNREGRRMTIVMDGNVAETVVYPGAAFLYSEEQTFNNGTAVTAGATVNKFVGFIDEERGIRHRAFGQVEFDLVSPSYVLDRIAMAPQYIQEVTSPADWTEVTSTLSNPNGVAWYILQHHCPAMLQLFDFDILSDATDLRDRTWALNGKSVWAQLREIAGQQINAGCISSGGLNLRHLPWLMDATDRAALDSRMTWTAADLDGRELLTYPTRFRLQVGMIDAYAFSYDGTNAVPYWSRAPGDAQAQGSDEVVVNGLLVPSATAQTRLNELAGHLFAWHNNPTPQLTLRAHRNLDTADPARMVWHAITISSALDPRSTGYTARKLCPEQVTRVWDQTDSGSWLKRIEIVMQPETAGQAGFTKPVPTDTDSLWDPSVSWLEFNDYPVYEDETVSLPSYIIVAHYASAKVARGISADNFATAPVYTDISTGLVGSVRWLKGDPFNARRYFAVTTDGLYRCDDVTTTSPVWYKVRGTEAIRAAEQADGFHYIEMTGHRQGLILLCNYTGHIEISFDYGENWIINETYLGGVGNGRNYWCMVQVSPLATETNPVVWLRRQSTLAKSVDWGLTYTTIATLSTEIGSGPINLPLFKQAGVPNDPAGLQTIYINKAYNNNLISPARPIQRTEDSGATIASDLMGTSAGAGNWGGFQSPSMRSLQSYTGDGAIVFAVERTNGTPAALRTVISDDSGTTAFATVNQPTALTNIDGANVNGWPSDPLRWLCWGFRDVSGPDGGFIACTADAGATAWVDCLGNLVSDGIFADGQIAYAEWLGV